MKSGRPITSDGLDFATLSEDTKFWVGNRILKKKKILARRFFGEIDPPRSAFSQISSRSPSSVSNFLPPPPPPPPVALVTSPSTGPAFRSRTPQPSSLPSPPTSLTSSASPATTRRNWSGSRGSSTTRSPTSRRILSPEIRGDRLRRTQLGGADSAVDEVEKTVQSEAVDSRLTVH